MSKKKKFRQKILSPKKFSQKNPKTEFSLQKGSKRSSTKPFKKKCTYRTIAKSKSIQDLQQKLSKRIPTVIYHTIYKKIKKKFCRKILSKNFVTKKTFPQKAKTEKKTFTSKSIQKAFNKSLQKEPNITHNLQRK